MSKIIFPKSLKVSDQTGCVRSILKGTERYPYELKITLDIYPAEKNMYIGLEEHDMKSILYHLKALGLIQSQPDEEKVKEFIEEWLEENWNEKWCLPVSFTSMLKWLIRLLQEYDKLLRGK